MGPARKTVLTFGMVSIPVGLVAAAKSDSDASLKMIAPVAKDGDGKLPERGVPVEQRYFDPASAVEVGGEEMVPLSELYGRDELSRAVPRGDALQPIDVEAYESLAERMEYMELVGFVPARDFEPYRERIACAHYLQPQPGSARPLGTLAKAMRAERVVGIVRFSVGTRERLGALVARDDGAVVALTLRFASRWKHPDEEVLAPALAQPSKAERALARQLVQALTVDAAVIDDIEDESRARQREMVESILAGEAPEAGREPSPPDLMAQLEASVEAATKGRRRRKRVAA
jgi:non-homologous end joining protein Ku